MSIKGSLADPVFYFVSHHLQHNHHHTASLFQIQYNSILFIQTPPVKMQFTNIVLGIFALASVAMTAPTTNEEPNIEKRCLYEGCTDCMENCPMGGAYSLILVKLVTLAQQLTNVFFAASDGGMNCAIACLHQCC